MGNCKARATRHNGRKILELGHPDSKGCWRCPHWYSIADISSYCSDISPPPPYHIHCIRQNRNMLLNDRMICNM